MPEAGEGQTVRVGGQVSAAAQIEEVCGGLESRDDDRDDSGDPLQFLSADVALFGETFECRNCDTEQLHDDGCVDVRGDGHGEQRRIVERVAAAPIRKIRMMNAV